MHLYEEDIYTDTDTSTHSESRAHMTYETVYSESVVQPSIFKQNVTDQNKPRPKSDTMVDEHNQAEKVDDELIVYYSPICLVNDAHYPHQRNLPEVFWKNHLSRHSWTKPEGLEYE